MAFAKCQECNHIFRWFAGKGCRVKDLDCPKCGSKKIKAGVSTDEYLAYKEN